MKKTKKERKLTILQALRLALEVFDGDTHQYTCHIVDRCGGHAAVTFYVAALRSQYPDHDNDLFPRFDECGVADNVRLSHKQLYTTRIVALQLAIELYEDGFRTADFK